MLGLYVHIPFCAAICNYCNFNRGLFDAELKDAVRRRAAAPRLRGAADGSPADTIFFGGGTPSLLEPAEIGSIIAACRDGVRSGADAEITLEANPETVTLDRLAGFSRRRRQSTEFRRPVVPRRRTAATEPAAFGVTRAARPSRWRARPGSTTSRST